MMGPEGLRPTVKKLEPEQQDQVEVAGEEEREERMFNPAGYEAHLVETIERDILQRNPDITWTKVAGLHEAKAILQEAMVLPMLMPDFFKVDVVGCPCVALLSLSAMYLTVRPARSALPCILLDLPYGLPWSAPVSFLVSVASFQSRSQTPFQQHSLCSLVFPAVHFPPIYFFLPSMSSVLFY